MGENKRNSGAPDVCRKRLPLWGGLLLSVGGGLLTFAAFPPVNAGMLVWIGLLPLLGALWIGARRPGRRGVCCYALYGWAYGLAYFGGSFWWINEVSTLGYIPLCMYLAIYPALWAALMGTVFRPVDDEEPAPGGEYAQRMDLWKAWAGRDMISTAKTALVGAALWVCTEWLRGWVMTGFGWNGLGAALHDSLALAQFAEYVGVTGLAFIPALANLCFWGVGRRLGRMMLREGRRQTPLDFFALCIVLILMFVWGSVLAARYTPANHQEGLPVVAIQRNMSQAYKWNRANQLPIYSEMVESTHAAFGDLMERMAGDPEGVEGLTLPAWVIWPESSLPISTYFSESTGEPLGEGNQYNQWFFGEPWERNVGTLREALPVDFVLITGEDEKWTDDEFNPSAVYNVMSAYPEHFESRRVYRKNHLVPFGEYIPLRDCLPILEDAFAFSAGGAMGANFSPGGVYEPLELPVRPGFARTVQVIPSVCFEDTVGRLLRRFARPGPQVIVNVTNDGWFNRSSANEQHWRNAAFRCIELRRSMIRAANTGVTVAIAPNGAPIAQLRDADGSPFTEGYLFARLPILHEGLTLYALAGDWFVILCALVVIGFRFLPARQTVRPLVERRRARTNA